MTGVTRARTVMVAVMVLSLVVACTGPRVRTIPPPENLPRESTTTSSIADPRAVQLGPVEGQPDQDLRIEGGQGVLRGTVVGPEGPTPGAAVRIVRVTSSGEASAQIATNESGQWELRDVQGGVYRVRAFLPPTLTVAEPSVFFLEAGQERTIDLTLRVFDGIEAAATVDPPETFIGTTANLTVAFAVASVAEDGTVVRVAVTGRVARVSVPSNLRLVTVNPEALDADGRVSWAFECLRAGTTQITVALEGGPTPTVTGPACVDPPPPEPDPEESTTTSGPNGPASSTTTSTTPSTTAGA